MNEMLCIIPYFDYVGNQHMVDNYKVGINSLLSQGVDVVTINGIYESQDWLEDFHEFRIGRVELPSVLWYKEALINYAFQKVVKYKNSYKYVAWIDAGLILEDTWVEQAIELLQHNDFVHCLNYVNWLKPDGSIELTRRSIVDAPSRTVGVNHGGAWVTHKHILEDGFRLYEANIVGGGDLMVVNGIMELDNGCHEKLSPLHCLHYLNWYNKVHSKHYNVSSTHNIIAKHLWHTTDKRRCGTTRFRQLADARYNPEEHITHDTNGMIQWAENTPTELIQLVSQYIIGRLDTNGSQSEEINQNQALPIPRGKPNQFSMDPSRTTGNTPQIAGYNIRHKHQI
jgi:hypothetical protein